MRCHWPSAVMLAGCNPRRERGGRLLVCRPLALLQSLAVGHPVECTLKAWAPSSRAPPAVGARPIRTLTSSLMVSLAHQSGGVFC